jgi:shikimate kinase
MKIFLIGLPGSGKTTVGKELARKLNVPFLDLDAEVEMREKRQIQQLFKTQGESYFRKIESLVLKEWCGSTSDFVMATGGGTPCFFDNMDQINKAGESFFLDVPTKEIANRIKKSNLNKRPLFENLHEEELKDKIEFLRSQRMGFYQKAHHRIVSDQVNVNDITSQLNAKKEIQE